MIDLFYDLDYVRHVVIKQCFKNEEFIGYECSFWLGKKLCIEFHDVRSLDAIMEKLSAVDSLIASPDSDFNRCFGFDDSFSEFYTEFYTYNEDDEDDEE